MVLTLAEELGVAVGKEIDHGSRVALGTADVLVTGLDGDERPAVQQNLVHVHGSRIRA